jgi:hypothetical protein
MNMLKLMACLTALISSAYFAAAADSATTNKETDLPTHVMGYMVNPDVREEANKLATSELRIAYLLSVIASNAVDTNEIENFRKSSAIRLVSVIKSTNSIAILVSNIDFVDAKYPERPAYRPLEAIGEPAVPYLLDVLKDPSTSSQKCDRVIEVLRIIKKARPYPEKWQAFVDEEKKKFPPEVRGRIDRKIWVDD